MNRETKWETEREKTKPTSITSTRNKLGESIRECGKRVYSIKMSIEGTNKRFCEHTVPLYSIHGACILPTFLKRVKFRVRVTIYLDNIDLSFTCELFLVTGNSFDLHLGWRGRGRERESERERRESRGMNG